MTGEEVHQNEEMKMVHLLQAKEKAKAMGATISRIAYGGFGGGR